MNLIPSLLVVAAQSGWADKIRQVPKQAWINIGLFVVVIVITLRTWRALKKINELAPYIAVASMLAIIFLYWIFNRTEPKFLSPFVDFLSGFLPNVRSR
ncbi:MAG: hypothetical protein A3G75_10370 [Verrucomicrobia bacterium RIFCSPLOWO2_12_FULL_64_8]|nr:MAG: hypothetical protein A3G75_10370 [Verrucomicrobia bacterium RIFCSPLOWO2_12_FULL_64_8]